MKITENRNRGWGGEMPLPLLAGLKMWRFEESSIRGIAILPVGGIFLQPWVVAHGDERGRLDATLAQRCSRRVFLPVVPLLIGSYGEYTTRVRSQFSTGFDFSVPAPYP